MKDYLNTKERENFIRLMHLSSDVERTLETNILTNAEKGDLKRVMTYVEKTITSVLKRMNPSSAKSFYNACKNSKMSLDTYGDREIDIKKRSALLEDAYDNNKEYFKLVELVFDNCCKNCHKDGSKCDIYKEFEKEHIYEFDGTDKCTNCKYSYEVIEK